MHRHTTAQQIVLRARIVMRAARAQTNAAIRHELEADTNTARMALALDRRAVLLRCVGAGR